MDEIKGRAWKFGDHIDTDQIIPAERLTSDNTDRLGIYAFGKVRPDFAKAVKQGDIIVAGRNFGCGSSREHAPRSLRQAGVACVVAESFARIFFRNSINVGLLVIECRVDADEGDSLTIRPDEGTILNESTGKLFRFKEYPPFVRDLIESGGLMAKIRKKGRCSK
ncbi:MAG: 3-isopropylmalate dehydratase small subunit [Methanomassiliicoccales archaeon]|nr:3-isopropylmalate dehydratase small subunit [Methanomassiliicoccales archaeon]